MICLSVHIIVHLYHFRKLVKYPVSGLLFGHNRQLHSTALSDKGDNISVRLKAGLCIDKDQVNIKATTEEKLGFTGGGLGISSQAVCRIESAFNYAGDDAGAVRTAGCGGCGGCPAGIR